MENNSAWVFPGQGSQAIGMGVELAQVPIAKAKLEQAEQILGWCVLEACQSREDKLSSTLYAQPCLYVVLSIVGDLMIEQGQRPILVAGYSLGEYVALCIAGVYGFETGLRLVKCRAELMASASDGTMVALLGYNRQELETAVQSTRGVAIADDDPDRAVISGTIEAIETVLAQVKVKRSVRWNVDKPFHTSLMAKSAAEFQQVLNSVPFQLAQIPVVSGGLNPFMTLEPSILKQRLVQQITQPVQWQAVSRKLLAEGAERVVEIGSSKFLSGWIQRVCPSITTALI